ncbi:MAG: hypothetical protein ACXWYC_06860 [Actinomycetota bacterium]
MEDFHALAAALGAGIADVRSCLILSSDGLVLAANPETAEIDARPARIKLAALGEPERGFLQFGMEVWCYVRRGPYAALVVTGTSIRPGLVIDQMEQVLIAAEDARSRREGLRWDPAVPTVATTKPRTNLHPEPRQPAERAPAASRSLEDAVVQVFSGDIPGARAASADPPVAPDPAHVPAGAEPPPTPEDAPADTPAADPWARPPSADGVDRFSLAREFSRLLQDDQNPADA